jgi:hypothetical protein
MLTSASGQCCPAVAICLPTCSPAAKSKPSDSAQPVLLVSSQLVLLVYHEAAVMTESTVKKKSIGSCAMHVRLY